jgi:cbb3-type cytochrome oxidase subunit 3
MEAFAYTLSFLQTMPRFLDLAFTFGEQEAVKDFHYTAFNAENFLDQSDAQKHCIPRLGRSGHEIRHCFNLWSVERSDSPPWSIRQSAVYHSFDVCTGRAAWINIKGNELMQERITQALSSTTQLQPSSLKTVSGAFSASILTLLIVFEWSGENWKSRINDLQKQLSDILMKAKNAPFKSIEEALSLDPNVLLQNLTATEEKAGKLLRRADSTVYSKQSRRTDTLQSALSSVSPKRILSGFSRASTNVDTEKRDSPVLTKATTPPSPPKLEPLLTSPTLLQQARWDSGSSDQSKFSVLQEFTVDGLQKLTDVASKMHEVKLVMKLNAEVINEVIDYYKTLAESDDMPMDIKRNCGADLNSFFRRARAVIRSLEMEQSRLDTLMRMFEDGKSLVSVDHILRIIWNLQLISHYQFDKIVQFRNMEVNKLFAINAHQSGKHSEMMTNDMHQSSLEMEAMTKSMKKVAEKTAIQTSSMHLITLVTLFFLPATFVAVRNFGLPSFSSSELTDYLTSDQTFFSSGAFQWDQEDPEGSSKPFWKPEFFSLFAAICFPMTGAIICVWWALYWRNNRMRRQHAQGDEEQPNILGVRPVAAS